MTWHCLMRMLDLVLRTALSGVVDRKLQALSSLAYALDKGSVWVVKNTNPQKLPPVPNRCLCEINKIGAEFNILTKPYYSSSLIEGEGILQLS